MSIATRRWRADPRRSQALSVFVLLGVLLGGCSPTYVIRAGYEEAKILWRRQPIVDVLAQSDLDPDVRRKLELVLDVRRYAEGIGLEVGGSFTTLSYVDGPTMLYVLTATPRTSLEPHTWWFPIVGSVPYKGFFDRTLAEAEAKGLVERGLDTSIRGAAAFSTLGWFDDPLLRHQLAGDEVALAILVFHELYHANFYAKGAHATALNESLANFVGHRAAIDFFAGRGADDPEPVKRARQAWHEEGIFASFIQRLAARLRLVYEKSDEATALAMRADLFMGAVDDFRTLALDEARFGRFDDVALNNAVLLQSILYTTDLDVFDAVFEQTGGLRPALDLIEAAAKDEPDDPFGAVKRALAAVRTPSP